jgi:hypothetical protein
MGDERRGEYNRYGKEQKHIQTLLSEKLKESYLLRDKEVGGKLTLQ